MDKPGWIARTTATSKPRATWAAVALAACSLLVQGVNFVKTDLKPLLEQGRKNQVVLIRIEEQVILNTTRLARIEKRLDEHERRIADLEQRGPQPGVFRRQK